MARAGALAKVPVIGRTHAPIGALLNLALRSGIVLMTIDVLIHQADERFAGKGLAPRDILISLVLAMVFPLFWRLRWAKREWSKYPWWFDDLYLSVFFVDMLGNELGLYDTSWWSNIPHGYGPAALAIVFTGAFGLTLLEGMGLSSMLHIWLQVEEMYGDILFGTHNFRDKVYEMNQFLYGLAVTLVFGAVWYFSSSIRSKRARPVHRPSK